MSEKFHIRGYDGLRGLSVLLVLLSHLGLYWHLPNTSLWRQRIWPLIAGETGVYVFFSLSGFLITSLLLSEKIKFGTINFRRFYIRRFLRLTPPLFCLYVTLLILMMFGLLPQAWLALACAALYLYNYVPDSIYTNELAHTWSLGVEEQYYLIWPAVVNFLGTKATLILASTIIILSVILSLILPDSLLYHGQVFYSLNRWIVPAIAPIMVGAIGAVILHGNGTLIEYFARVKWPALLAMLLYATPLYAPLLLSKSIFIVQTMGITALLVWLFANQHGTLAAILEWRPLAYVGRISYGIYVWQGLFLRNGPGGKLPIQHFPANIVLVFIVAALSYFLIERPVLAFKERFSPKHDRPQPNTHNQTA